MFGPRKNNSFVGVDIGADFIKIACIEPRDNKPALKHSITFKNQSEIFDGFKLINPREIGTLLKGLLKEYNIQPTAVACVLPSLAVFTKRFNAPLSVSKNKLNKIMKSEAERCIPYDINAVNYDCQICGIVNDTQLELMLVAVKQDVVNGYTEAFKHAGIELSVMDVANFALERAFSFNYPDIKEQRIALVNVGHRSTEMVVMHRGKAIAYFDCEVGSRMFIESLSEVFQITFREAGTVFRGDVDNIYDKNLYQQTIDNVTKHLASALVDKLRKQQINGDFEDIKTVYFAGGGILQNNLQSEFSAKSSLACLQMYPTKNILNISRAGEPDAEVDKMSAALMGVAIGAALRLLDEE